MSGSLFIDTPGSVNRPGVYAVEVTPPRIIRGVSNGYIGLVGKFAWGPLTEYQPTSGDDLMKTYEPAGSPRTSSGYYAIMQRLGAPWAIAGIKGVGSATATLTMTGTGGNIVITGKFAALLGNSIAATLGAASNGDATMRSLTLVLTNATTGTTKETFDNIPMGGPIDAGLLAKSRLVASINFTGTMTAWPANNTTNLASGSDGAALVATDYDTAFGLLDLDPMVRIYVADDCGDTIRATVNTNMITRVLNLTNRVAYVHGSPLNTWAQVKTDKAGLSSSDRVNYFGTWVMCLDDGGVLRRSPLATFAATARVALDVHQSIAWRDPKATKYFTNVKSLDSSCPFNPEAVSIQEEATTNGIITLKVLPGPTQGTTAGYGILHGRTCNLVSGFRYEVTRWYKDYLALTLVPAVDTFVNGPNGTDDDVAIKGMVDRFMGEEKTRYKHVVDFSTDINSVNDATTKGNGDFFLGLDAQTPGVRERIYFLMNVGETVTVRQAA